MELALRNLNKEKGRKEDSSVDYSALRGLIREVFGTQEAFAEAIDRSPCTVSQKLNGSTEWTTQDIRKACEALGIPAEKIPQYFFCPNR
jgi:hypothetical protein